MSGRLAKPHAVPRRLKFRCALIGATAVSVFAAASFAGETDAPPVRTASLKLLAYPQSGHRSGLALGRKGKWTPTAADALRLALAQVGVTGDANGGGTIYQKWFVASPWAVRGVERDGGSIGDYANANWCDIFISWIGDQLGVRGMGADAFTPTHAQWFKDHGRWGQTPIPGAIVFFSWSGGKSVHDIDHVGMVIKDDHDGTIQTVEGNTGNAVKIRTRDTSTVVGYGYPHYAPARAG
jgi:hypothetical protein